MNTRTHNIALYQLIDTKRCFRTSPAWNLRATAGVLLPHLLAPLAAVRHEGDLQHVFDKLRDLDLRPLRLAASLNTRVGTRTQTRTVVRHRTQTHAERLSNHPTPHATRAHYDDRKPLCVRKALLFRQKLAKHRCARAIAGARHSRQQPLQELCSQLLIHFLLRNSHHTSLHCFVLYRLINTNRQDNIPCYVFEPPRPCLPTAHSRTIIAYHAPRRAVLRSPQPQRLPDR